MAPIAYEDLEVDEDGAGDGMENDGEPRGQADQQTEEQVISKDTLNIYKVLWYIQHLLSIYIYRFCIQMDKQDLCIQGVHEKCFYYQEFLQPSPHQHLTAIGCSENGQTIGVIEHLHCFENSKISYMDM